MCNVCVYFYAQGQNGRIETITSYHLSELVIQQTFLFTKDILFEKKRYLSDVKGPAVTVFVTGI